jgi:2-oxoglutarate ferredoxin oxidoreductase subunit beta
VDITYIIMDNEVYGLTKGQPSPTTPPGMLAVSKASSMLKMAPQGVMETPLNIMAMVLTYGASFAARGFSGKPNDLADLYVKAIDHKGFSFIQALSPCVTFYDTYGDWKTNVAPLPEDWDAGNRIKAIELAMTESTFHCGIFTQEDRPTLTQMTQSLMHKGRIKDRNDGIQQILASYA